MRSHNGKFFSKSWFSFQNTFWNILNRFRPKKKSTKNFCLCHFSTCDPIFRKIGCQVTMGKNFRNRDFCFKTRFGPFWIDFDQKKFSTKNLSSPFFRPETPFFEKMAMSSHNGHFFSKSRFSFWNTFWTKVGKRDKNPSKRLCKDDFLCKISNLLFPSFWFTVLRVPKSFLFS